MQSVVGVAMVPEAILEKLEPMEGGGKEGKRNGGRESGRLHLN